MRESINTTHLCVDVWEKWPWWLSNGNYLNAGFLNWCRSEFPFTCFSRTWRAAQFFFVSRVKRVCYHKSLSLQIEVIFCDQYHQLFALYWLLAPQTAEFVRETSHVTLEWNSISATPTVNGRHWINISFDNFIYYSSSCCVLTYHSVPKTSSTHNAIAQLCSSQM